MASLRSPSPSPSDGSSSPPGTPMTPRTKIKALLATVGDSSDDEQASPIKKLGANAAAQLPSTSVDEASATRCDDQEGDVGSDDDIVRPRGRLASRMQASYTNRVESDPESEDDARERVKRMLQQKASVKETSTEGQYEEDDEDEEVVARPRRVKNRVRHSSTPEAVPSQREESHDMFVTPHKDQPPLPQAVAEESGSDSDFPANPLKNERFLALIAKKRSERPAKEADERKEAARREARQAAEETLVDDDDSDITDDEGGRKLTQDGRPAARKASKKALEEMNRETQRMSRSLQLAHEAKTRKKITKASLFERFNFKPAGDAPEDKLSSSSRPATPISAHHTDAEMRDAETPPSSPPALQKGGTPSKLTVFQQPTVLAEPDSLIPVGQGDEFPSISEVPASALQKKPDKGKGKATAADLEDPKPAPKRQLRVKLPIQANLVSLDPDDELVIMETKKSKLDAILDRVPAKREKESRSMLALRHLAQVTSPGKESKKRCDKHSLTAAELQAALIQRARQQAKLERDRRVELLKAKGIHIQTEEEREQEMVEVEDIVARARKEAEEIMQREREAAKKEKKDKKKNGEVDPLAWDDSSDDSEAEYRDEPSEIELSGSGEDEDMASDEDEEADDGGCDKDSVAGGLFDNEAESGDESEDVETEILEEGQAEPTAESDGEMANLPTRKPRRAKKRVTILSDDDENEAVAKTPKPKTAFPKSPSAQRNTDSPQVPTSVLRSATKTFIPGLPVVAGAAAGLGLTQIFAGTMDDSQAGPAGASPSQPKPTFENFPDSQFSENAAENADEHGEEMVVDSQPTQQATTQLQDSGTQVVQIHFSQSQMHGFDSLIREPDATQLSQVFEPTQDGGYRNYTPLKERFIEAPPSTVETVAVDSQPNPSHTESPLLQRRGRLQRRTLPTFESDDEAEPTELVALEEADEDEFDAVATAFTVMKNAAEKEKRKKAVDAFNKKKSKAKEMIEEQAAESEDEYAGLGGADGEDSDDDSAASVKDMIDDDHKSNEVDDVKLAAFFADRERASDEKQVEKLFRDITSGQLRRKRGADYDLSDSDDGGEARRRMKRRQFAKMQKALFADERISKVAENPRNQAFLRTIEDHGSDEEMDFLFEAPPAQDEESQSTSQEGAAIPDSQPAHTIGTNKKPLEHAATGAGNRPPATQRRTKDGKKPSNIGEIRESLSTLLDDDRNASIIPATLDPSSDSDADDEDNNRPSASSSSKENRSPRKRRRRDASSIVVDRISLKRAGSSTSSASSSTSGGRMAFAAPSAAGSGFKVPALLRRATTNSLISNTSTGSNASGAGSSGGAGGFGDEGKIKKGAGKRSGIKYFARENEQREAIAESEKRREAKKFRGAKGRGRVVGGLFGAGKFE